jgi:hypothetical protein
MELRSATVYGRCSTLDPLDHPLTSLVLAVAAYGRFVRGGAGIRHGMSERSLAVDATWASQPVA